MPEVDATHAARILKSLPADAADSKKPCRNAWLMFRKDVQSSRPRAWRRGRSTTHCDRDLPGIGRPPLDDHLNAGWAPASHSAIIRTPSGHLPPVRRSFERRTGGRAPKTMQNIGRWGLRDHPIEKCVENPPGADGGQPGYLRLFRRHPIRAFFEHEKAAHFSNEWAFRGRRRSFFHRMGARGNGATHFFPTDGPLMDRGGSKASRAGGPAVRGVEFQRVPSNAWSMLPKSMQGPSFARAWRRWEFSCSSWRGLAK